MALRRAGEADDVPDAVEWQAGGRHRGSAEGEGAGFRLAGEREGSVQGCFAHFMFQFASGSYKVTSTSHRIQHRNWEESSSRGPVMLYCSFTSISRG